MWGWDGVGWWRSHPSGSSRSGSTSTSATASRSASPSTSAIPNNVIHIATGAGPLLLLRLASPRVRPHRLAPPLPFELARVTLWLRMGTRVSTAFVVRVPIPVLALVLLVTP